MRKTIGLILFLALNNFMLLTSCSQMKSKSVFKPVNQKADLYYDYGTKYLVEKNYSKALKNLRKAYKFDPKSSHINNNLGMAYFFKKDIKSALTHLRKSVELDEKNSDARNNLASVYFYQKKYKQAYNEYSKILKDLEYTQQYRTLYNMALIDLKFKRNTIALKRLHQAIDEKPDYCAAHYQLGAYALVHYNYNQALDHFKDASHGTCINNPAPNFQKAKAYIKLGQHQKALTSLQDIINRFPKSRYSILAKRKLQSISIKKMHTKKMIKEDHQY